MLCNKLHAVPAYFVSGNEDDIDVQLEVPDIPSCFQRSIVVSHDNATNITKAITDSSMLSIRCFAHTLNLAVQKFVRVINEHISGMREIVKHIQKSSSATKLVKVCHIYAFILY